ncbi:MAG: SpoVR family protein [Oligoflexales bacterium]|nr:SpoVR family protein [Oligoflexales bacterium]
MKKIIDVRQLVQTIFVCVPILFTSVFSAFGNEVSVVSSHRDAEVIDDYEREAQIITDVAEKLGYAIPKKHHLTFVPAGDLGQLAALGRYALPHWYDGAQVFNGMGQISGVLEFVTKGDPASKSFYSDTTDYIEQISIIMHVIGHNDFALQSEYALSTRNYTMPASLELYNEISKLYQELDHEEVSLFVQWLYSIQYLQDFVDGSHEEPEKFITSSPTTNELIDFKKQKIDAGSKDIRPLVNKINTPSVLSASVHHLSGTAAQWKTDLISKFEKMVRHYPGNIHTKIINEGWATFTQYLLAKHTHWNEREDAFVQLSSLMQGVAFPRVSNPYWLGLECWRNVYRKFKKQHGHEYGSELELDSAFVREAHERIALQSSYDFIRESLDETWVREQQLMMYREATPEEIETYAPGRNIEKGLIVVSRNHERIINAIAREQADFSLVFPKIHLTSFNDRSNGGIALEHMVRHNIPLDLMSAAQALYVYSILMEKPISLKTIFYDQGEQEGTVVIKDAIINVYPSGKVVVEAEGSEQLQMVLQQAVDVYIGDLEFSETEALSKYRHERFDQMIQRTLVNRMLAPATQDCSCNQSHGSFITHAPTTGRALLEYEALMSDRFGRMLGMAVKGQIDVHKGQNGVQFRVLPIIPQFQLDSRIHNLLKQFLPPSPVDQRSSLPNSSYVFGQDDNTQIGRHKTALPGDIFEQPDGEGQGGDGDPEDGESEEQDGDPEDAETGEGGNDPSEVEIPLSDWGMALQEEIGLPNMRITNFGESKLLKRKKNGAIKRNWGDVVYRRTVPAALLYPLSDSILNDEEFDFSNIVDALIEGIPRITPADYMVKSHKEVPKPQNKAVVVVVMDFSGSMQGEAHQMAANLVYNFKALMLNQYEDIEFRYVVYDTEAQEFSEDDVFGKNPKFLGGGTSNVAGYKIAEEVLAEYSYDEWNKYVLGIGDAGAPDGPETVEILESIYPETQSISFVYTNNGFWADQGFLTSMQDYADRMKWMGYSELSDSSQASIVRVLKELFPPN